MNIVTDEELKKADFAICLRASEKSNFTDNLYDSCFFCKERVMHRPYIPRKTKKVCTGCVGKIKDYKGN